MSETTRSFFTVTTPLWIAFGLAVVLWLRRGRVDTKSAAGLRNVFLLGISLQCLHALEEYLTDFATRVPERLEQAPWPEEWFMTFNVLWIAIWVAASVGIVKGVRIAVLPIWFFGIGMTLNLIGHPLLALLEGGYFPGLFTSPFVGVAGILVLRKLWAATARDVAPT